MEAGGIHYGLSAPLADTRGGYLRATRTRGPSTLRAAVTHLDRFDDTGTQFGVGYDREIGPDYLARIDAATSGGGFFWPRLRVDASAGRRWLARRNLVTWVGVGYYDAKDAHEDVSVSFDAAYYFGTPWIAMGGLRVNDSQPGGVVSTSGYMALTHGRDRGRYVTLRYGTGNQAYEPLAAGTAAVDFPFHQVTLTCRQWLGRNWGVNVVVDGLRSDAYDQTGVEVGVFADF